MKTETGLDMFNLEEKLYNYWNGPFWEKKSTYSR